MPGSVNDRERSKYFCPFETHRQRVHKQLRRQCRIDFECAEDARLQAQVLAQQWLYHDLADIQVQQQPQYERAGRPRKGETPSHFTYRVTAAVVEDDKAIEQAKQKAGRFIGAPCQKYYFIA